MNLKAIIPFLLVASLVIALPAHAQIVPCGGPTQSACTFNDLFVLLQNIYNFLLGLAGLCAMLFLIWGGIQMFFVAASDSEIQSAKSTILNAIIGIVIIAAAYLIVNSLIVFLGGGTLPTLLQRLGLQQGVVQ